jgi:hypothetical protein
MLLSTAEPALIAAAELMVAAGAAVLLQRGVNAFKLNVTNVLFLVIGL